LLPSTGEKCRYQVALNAFEAVDDVDCKQTLEGRGVSAITSKFINVINDSPSTTFLIEFIDKTLGSG
jgi:hypothetical protein